MKSSVTILAVLALCAGWAGAARGQGPAQGAGTNAVKVAWEEKCEATDAWHDNAFDATLNTQVSLEKGKDVVKITHDGNDTWGKAFVTAEDIDLKETPTLEVKVNMVEKASAFKVLVAPTDWSEQIEVIGRSSADGLHKADIQKAVRASRQKAKWEGVLSLHVVVVIEGRGKSVYIDSLKIRSGK